MIAAVAAIAWIGLPSGKRAPAERNTIVVSNVRDGRVLRLPVQALSP